MRRLNPSDVKQDCAAWTLQKARLGDSARLRVSLSSIRTSVMSGTGFSRRTLLKSAALGAAGAALDLGALQRAFAAADLTVGDRLCRRARRFRLEPGARGRDQVAEGSAGGQGRRGRERPGNRRGLEVDGIDDQSRRRRPHSGDVVRLLHAVRRRPGEEISGRPVPPRGAALEQGQGSEERRLLFRLSQSGALRERRRRRPFDQDQQDRLRRGEADRERAQQHQFGPARRAFGQSRTRRCR